MYEPFLLLFLWALNWLMAFPFILKAVFQTTQDPCRLLNSGQDNSAIHVIILCVSQCSKDASIASEIQSFFSFPCNELTSMRGDPTSAKSLPSPFRCVNLLIKPTHSTGKQEGGVKGCAGWWRRSLKKKKK